MVRVLIISAIRLYRDGLAQVLGGDDDVEVVGAFDTTTSAIGGKRGDAPGPDVVLLDTADPRALDDMRLISGEFPGVKVVGLGVGHGDDDVIACAEAGIAGYVFREASLDELVATVQSSARGELRCSPELAGTLLRRVANLARAGGAVSETAVTEVLTRREKEIVDLIERAYSNKQIAGELFIEVATVKNHIHNILEKLGVRTRGEAAAKLRGTRGARGRGGVRIPRGVHPLGTSVELGSGGRK